ncbi:MAG: DUF4906 domain-containing protein [Prevotella sp.]|nr:DUF4906 domain-containing protein [Prevotella sp.]
MKKILLLTAMIVAGMMTTSCSSDNDGVEQQTNNQTGVIALKAEVVPMNTLQEGERTDTRSRVISAEFENTINNIHIVVFGSDGKKIKHFYSPMYVDNPYTTLLNIGSSHAGETVTIYAIANVGDADMFENLENVTDYTQTAFEGLNLRVSATDGVQSIGQGTQLLYSQAGTNLTTINNAEAPVMVTKLENVTVANNGLTRATLSFTRQNTKITLNLIPQKMKIVKYRVCSIPKISYMFNKGTNVSGVEYGDIPYVEVPAADQSKQIKQAFYVYENYNENIVGATKQTDRCEANIPNGAHPTYVEIVGIPDGFTDQYLYRVYLGGVSSQNEIQYHKITLLRNYEYYVTVKLAGDGTGDPRVSKVE